MPAMQNFASAVYLLIWTLSRARPQFLAHCTKKAFTATPASRSTRNVLSEWMRQTGWTFRQTCTSDRPPLLLSVRKPRHHSREKSWKLGKTFPVTEIFYRSAKRTMGLQSYKSWLPFNSLTKGDWKIFFYAFTLKLPHKQLTVATLIHHSS